MVRYSVISVTILWFYLFYLTHLLNARQMLTYYPTLILNVFAMMPEKNYYCWNVKGDGKLSFSLSAQCFILKRSRLSCKVIITESWITDETKLLHWFLAASNSFIIVLKFCVCIVTVAQSICAFSSCSGYHTLKLCLTVQAS